MSTKPKPRKPMKVDAEIHAKLKIKAAKMGITLEELVNRTLLAGMKKEGVTA